MEILTDLPDRTRYNDLMIDGFKLEHRGAGWYALKNSDRGYSSWQWIAKMGPKPSHGDFRLIQVSN